MKEKKETVVVVSGGFDPVHSGHVRLFKEAKELGDKLIVILNNDNWLMKKKNFVFMPENERKEIIESIRYVDEVFLSMHKPDVSDMSVSVELAYLRPDVFANGGDRDANNVPESEVCKRIGCKMVFNVGAGGKIQSSSWLIEKAIKSKLN
ncbi:MAG TPA: adenylyltransferase/cytidyltransferase family protein [Patescibacteria group bacterium]|nr:adenylyltransferase/cytidyltransferase family protein [Patescibacteria group bacterium]